jgi:hypothetical protein
MTPLVVIFLLLLATYVVYTVKNNLGSCDNLSNDQSVNDICLHDMHMITATVNMLILQKHIFETLTAKLSVLYWN